MSRKKRLPSWTYRPGMGRLEDFGVRGTASPQSRLEEYRAQAKQLAQNKQAKYLLECIDKDPEVGKIWCLKVKP